jgi:hypothetical protein
LLAAEFLIARAPATGAAEARLAYDGTATLIAAATISFVIIFDIAIPLILRPFIGLSLCHLVLAPA